MENEAVAVCAVGLVESVTSTLIGKFPTTVGVPLITPVELFSDRPVGNDPNWMLHVSGETPFTAVSVAV